MVQECLEPQSGLSGEPDILSPGIQKELQGKDLGKHHTCCKAVLLGVCAETASDSEVSSLDLISLVLLPHHFTCMFFPAVH